MNVCHVTRTHDLQSHRILALMSITELDSASLWVTLLITFAQTMSFANIDVSSRFCIFRPCNLVHHFTVLQTQYPRLLY